MSSTRKLKLSWQLRTIVAILIVTPIAVFSISAFKKNSIAMNVQQARGIASVSEENVQLPIIDVDSQDLSELNTEELKKAFKYQLLRDVHATRFKDSINLSLGLFYVKNESGTKVFVCDRFSNIQVTVKSDKGLKVIESPCNISDDQNHIEASVINFEGRENLKITDVKLVSDNNKQDFLEVDASEIKSVLGQTIAVEEIR